MKADARTDIQCISRLVKHINSISEAFAVLNISNINDYLANNICQLATAQAITNIHELKKKLREETLDKLPTLCKVRTKFVRNIASHDYDKLDFQIIFDRLKQLLNPAIIKELERVQNELQNNSKCN